MFFSSKASRILGLALKPQSITRNFTTSRITRNEPVRKTFADLSKQFQANSPSNIFGPNSTAVSNTKKVEVIHKYMLYAYFSKNNTHLTLTAVTEDINYLNRNKNLTYNQQVLYYAKLPQKVKISLSGGNAGFRKSARGEYEAGFQASAKMFALMEEKGFLDKDLELVLRDFGKGREAFQDALKGKEGNRIRNKIVRISDATRLKQGGVRAPRRRRL